MNECLANADKAVQERTRQNAQRANACIETADLKARDTIKQARNNLQTDANARTTQFDTDADRLSACAAANNMQCSRDQVGLINRNVDGFGKQLFFRMLARVLKRTLALKHLN